jgi:hypothetical protein
MDHGNSHPPDIAGLAFFDANRRMVIAVRKKKGMTALAVKPSDHKLTIYRSDDDPLIVNGKRSVNDQNVAGMNAGRGHGISLDPDKKRCGWMANKVLIQIQSIFMKTIDDSGKTN